MKEEKNTEKLFFESGLNKITTVEVEIDKPTIWQKIKKQTKKSYKIKPLVMSDLLAISSVLTEIPAFDNQLEKKLESSSDIFDFIADHGEKLVKIVSILLNENQNFIRNNLTPENLKSLFIKIVELADITSFFYCMSLTKQKMNLKTD